MLGARSWARRLDYDDFADCGARVTGRNRAFSIGKLVVPGLGAPGQQREDPRRPARRRSTPTAVTTPARLLCAATGSAGWAQVGREPAATGGTPALRGTDSPDRRCSSSSIPQAGRRLHGVPALVAEQKNRY
jgi:hypothetical protein